jgi:ecotin
MKKLIMFLALTVVGSAVNAQNSKDVSMFPEAEQGYKKVVIYLPKQKVEDNYKLEITVGKTAQVDKCNRYFLMGEIKGKELNGWGYTYYNFISNGDIAGTKMACPTDEKVNKFISGESEIIRYNSKLPVVIYVPTSMDVQYRYWTAKSKWSTVK